MTKRLDHPYLYLPIKGAPKNTIPYILSKGFELCGVSDIMFLSLNNSFYTDNNIATADTFYRGKDGTGKLVLNDPFLKLTNHKMILNSLNTLDISESQYQSLSGTNVKKVSKNRIQGRDGINKSPYKKEDVIKIPEWQFLAQSQKLLENYVNSVYSSFYTLFASHFEEE
jgi:hypothetical protein